MIPYGSEESVEISGTPQADGSTSVKVAQKGGSPVNLMASSDSLPDAYYFQVRIVDKGSSVSVGVVTPTEFQPGYKNKGMFYNGNLTNGSAALKTSFGPHLKSGDLVALECAHISTDEAGSSFAMTVYLNGKKIGRGFEIATTDPSQRFVPCLAATGNVDLMVQVLADQPNLSVAKVSVHPLEGKWKIVNAKKDASGKDHAIPVHDESGNPLPDQRDIIMDIAPADEEKIRVSVHVFNNIGVTMGYNASLDKMTYETSASGGPMMTMMMPPPPYDRVEQELSKAIVEHWHSFRLSDVVDGEAKKLTITTVQNHVMAHCGRFVNEGAALTKYHR
ncbi:MAG: hypothetical protein SGARI_002729 [Bacillariaceae sp.]